MSLRYDDVAPIGQVATGSLLWRSHGRLHLTVIVKVSYGLKPGGLMRQVDPPALNDDDVHYDRRPTRSVKKASDEVPYLPKTDVLFTGSVYSPAKLPIPFTKARLAVHGDRSLIDKTLGVYGDRELTATGSTSAKLFTELPLVYERAVRDPRGMDNPVGIDPKTTGPLPNIIHQDNPDQVAGFGPISRYWRTRRDRISPRARELLGSSIMEIGRDFDWSYFNAAPLDQRCRHLSGDEWVVVEGMDPKICAVHSRLPGDKAVACVWPVNSQSGLSYPVQMTADRLFIDGDARTCTVSWRGSFPIARQDVLEAIYIGAGVQRPNEPVDWRAAKAAVVRSHPRPETSAVVTADLLGTLTAVEHVRQAVQSTSDPAASTEILLSSDDLIEIVEPVSGSPASAVPVDQGPQAAVDQQPQPRHPTDDLLATMQYERAARSGALAQDASRDSEGDDMIQTRVSHPADEDELLQTIALASRIGPSPEQEGAEDPGADDSLLQTVGLTQQPAGHSEIPWDQITHVKRSRISDEPPSSGEVAPVASAPPPSTAPTQDALGGTIGITHPANAPPLTGTQSSDGPPSTDIGAPFALAEAAEEPVVLRPAAVPGAPWCDGPEGDVPPPSGDPMAETYQLDPSLAAAVVAGSPASSPTDSQPPSVVETQFAELAPELRTELLNRLRRQQSVADLDLSGKDLSGIDFTGGCLAQASFRGASFRGGCLANADLSGAELVEADLSNARLDGAKLDGANLSSCVLRRASLKGAALHRANLSQVDGRGADLSSVRGSEASFAGGNWVGAWFSDAQIDQAQFSQAVLDRAVFDRAVLRQARLDDVRAIGVSFDGATLFQVSGGRAVCLSSNFARAAAQGSHWQDANLDDSSFSEAALEGASFAGASCQRVDFSHANLRGAALAGARLDDASLRNARLSESSLVGLDLTTADLTGADRDG